MAQLVSQRFHDLSQGDIIPIRYDLSIAFDKSFDDAVDFFQLNVSQLDSMSLIAPTGDNPIQQWDKFDYKPFTDRVKSIEYSREIDFPYSVHSAMADFVLDNTDGYFTPGGSSPLAEFILPKRPLRINIGYETAEMIPQFVGMTQRMPEVANDTRLASFHALDFLSEMYEMPLNSTIAMRDVYTGEVIEAVLKQYGLRPEQYNIAKGRNQIPFVFFERKNIKAGEVLRRLMQAEMGNLWLTEDGIIRFEPRLMDSNSPVMLFNDNNVVEIQSTGDSEIINVVRINSPLREVQEFQTIWSKAKSSGTSGLHVVPAGGTLVVEANLSDPCYSVVKPTQGHASNVSWFTATRPDGTEVPSGVVVTEVELLTNSYVMTFSNSNVFSVNIEEAELWGEPAKQYDEIEYEMKESDSIAKYGEQVLEISNDFFQTESNCESFAYMLLDSYAEFSGVIEATVLGDPSLELGDVVTLNTKDYSGDFKIIKITHVLPERFVIRARRYTVRDWFVLNKSQLNSTDQLAP